MPSYKRSTQKVILEGQRTSGTGRRCARILHTCSANIARRQKLKRSALRNCYDVTLTVPRGINFYVLKITMSSHHQEELVPHEDQKNRRLFSYASSVRIAIGRRR